MAKDFSIGDNFAKSLQNYIIDSNQAVEFKLVRTAADIDNSETSFHPDMSHQIYGDSEQIFGYRNLKIKLYYSASRLTTYLSHIFDEKVNPDEFEGVKPDDVIKPIVEKIPPGYLTNIDHFTQCLDKDESFKPYGEMINRFTLEAANGEDKVFEIYFNDISPKGFLEYHERLQTFLLFYVDASSYIDTDDERWRFFLVYEKYMVNGNPHFAVAGYSTVYNYYAYPSNIRPRISQMIILPPFQRIGLGAEMLQTLYRYYRANASVVDITVEDPSENFQRLRDFVDARSCLELKNISMGDLPELTPEIQTEIQTKLKLNKRQIRRIYEILKLQKVNKHDETQYKTYRLFVKSRLNAPFRKEDRDMKKLKNVLSAEELTAALSITSKEQRLEVLDNLYKALEDEYNGVVEKLNNAH